ncbi:ROK family transcriptional regulator [Paramicrobacterium agarici]|uniref:ROK family transcriptional regulator n=1 Tax=Paramicrobacterium agarici TaxID=630514 RepID=UPI001154132C|nr:ROK family protein [Microbacterium agarici]TQO22923.1 putative NBD/HSP70 family sugar kinase [Microbacterium agarici]
MDNQGPLSETERAVLAAVYRRGETTKPELVSALQFSAPTIGTAISILQQRGLVAMHSERKGGIGRAAAVYGLSGNVGWLLGIDIGTTKVMFLARSLSGQTLYSKSYPVDSNPAAQAEQVERILRSEMRLLESQLSPENGDLRGIGIALPRIISAYVNADIDPRDPARHKFNNVVSALGVPSTVPIVLENNVNCSALAELTCGQASEYSHFVFIQVGVGVGAGIVTGGRLIRGTRGAAGEIAAIPLKRESSLSNSHSSYELEEYLGSEGLLKRVRESWGGSEPCPRTTLELFQVAEEGSEQARSFVHQHAVDISWVIAALTAVLDPECVVVGGGVGQNEFLFAEIEAALHDRRRDFVLRRSRLGEDASVTGAVELTLDFVLRDLLGKYHDARLEDHQIFVLSNSSNLE